MFKILLLCVTLCCSFSSSLAATVSSIPYAGGSIVEPGEGCEMTYVFSSASKRVAVMPDGYTCDIYDYFPITPTRCSLKYLITIYKDETVYSGKGDKNRLGKIDLKSKYCSSISDSEALSGWKNNTVLQRFLAGEKPSNLVYVGKYHNEKSHGMQTICGRVKKTQYYVALRPEGSLNDLLQVNYLGGGEDYLYLDNLEKKLRANERICVTGTLYEGHPEGMTELFFDETSAKIER